jgi:hypothetical protein
MSAANPRYYKWYPTVSCDLGTMPFEGDFTTDDRIVQMGSTGIATIYISNAAGTEFGRYVTTKDARGRTIRVWTPGVTVGPVIYVDPTTQEEIPMPVWFVYCGDGVCTVKVPEGEIEPVEA